MSHSHDDDGGGGGGGDDDDDDDDDEQAHREGGVAGASAPGSGGHKGAGRAPLKKIKLV